MSFIQSGSGVGFKAGYFLVDDEKCTRVTKTIAQNHAAVVTLGNGCKVVPAGSVIPANGSTAVGILYEDIDVTTGDMPGSVVTNGIVYEDRLPASVESDAKTAMTGIKFVATEPVIARPVFDRDSLASLTVASEEGSASGKSKITVSGYTPVAGEKYLYKAAASNAPSVTLGEKVDTTTWSALTSGSEYTLTTDQKLGVVSVDSTGAAVAYGSATIVSKT